MWYIITIEKMTRQKEIKKMTVEMYLLNNGLKKWEKGDKRRIYINDLSVVKSDKYTPNPKSLRKVTMYYDINADKFFYSGVTSSNEDVVNNIINGIREDAALC